jgi:hypothetical protein
VFPFHSLAFCPIKTLQLHVLVECVRELAKYGPMKSEAERGLSEAQIREVDDEKANVDLDPNGIRVGIGARAVVLHTRFQLDRGYFSVLT